MRKHLSTIVVGLLILVVTAACAPGKVALSRVEKNAVIDLNPTGPSGPITNPGTFNINTPNNGCVRGSGQRNGCVRFTANEDGTIIFALNGNSPPRTCDQNASRVISKIQFTATDAEGDPDSQPSAKGDFGSSSYPLAEEFKTEGFPALNVDTGIVYEGTDNNPAKNKVVIENKNASKVTNPVGRIIWYQVTVKKCSADAYWVTDPRIENDGMK